MDPEKLEHALTLYDSKQFTIKQIEKKTDVSKAKLYQLLKEREIKGLK
ncbi:hypothetical protein [Peribacillus simplex]